MTPPDQPLVDDEHGTRRFRQNAIVRYLLDNGGIDLNALAVLEFSAEDQMQFAQLIGYSLSGYGDLDYVTDEAYQRAANQTAKPEGLIERITQDGYTICVWDFSGAAHCFRIDKELGGELVALHAAAKADQSCAGWIINRGEDEWGHAREPAATCDPAFAERLREHYGNIAPFYLRPAPPSVEIDTPEIVDFLEGVKREAAHQIKRWGYAHDRSKSAENWFWLVGYLAGKALRAAISGDKKKAQHHTISSAAALLNWHAAISHDTTGAGIGQDADLRVSNPIDSAAADAANTGALT